MPARRALACRRRLGALAAAACVLAAAACADDEGARPPAAGGLQGALTVFAAASLTAAFTELGEVVEAAHPGVDLTFNFAASSELVTQIADGAPADVFASADQANMAKLAQAGGAASDPVVFATNLLEIVVAPGNRRGIAGLADLVDEDLVVVTCAPEVPCGRYAEQAFTNAGVQVTPKSLEQHVKAVLTKVVLGEADAGIVYRTDVLAAGADAAGVAIPEGENVVAEYPIAVIADAPNAAAARAFVDVVLSDAGQDVLATYGFLGP